MRLINSARGIKRNIENRRPERYDVARWILLDQEQRDDEGAGISHRVRRHARLRGISSRPSSTNANVPEDRAVEGGKFLVLGQRQV